MSWSLLVEILVLENVAQVLPRPGGVVVRVGSLLGTGVVVIFGRGGSIVGSDILGPMMSVA